MNAWLILALLGAMATVLLVLAVRAEIRIVRTTIERSPRLRPTVDINALPAWQAVRLLSRYTDEIQGHAAADPDMRKEIRLKRAYYIAAAICGILPLIYALLTLETLLR